MGAEKDIIVAVELGSTAIRAIAGKRQPDGSMRVLAIAQEDATNCIRKGIVDNIDKTTQTISNVIQRLNEKLNVHITKVYVGLSGQSLHTVLNKVEKNYDSKTQIGNEIVDQLKDINGATVYPDSKILDVVPQEYQIGNRSIPEPVGMLTDHLEARFLNIVARRSLSENIEKCIRGAGVDIADIFISPLCLANSLLSASEKRSGCALVDFGANTTTVAIYTKNILRYLGVIPLGGANVTADIASKNIEFEEAEKLKLDYAAACHEDTEEEAPRKLSLSFDRSIPEDLFREIVEARYKEIFANIWVHIKPECDKLLSGIIFCGGASKTRKISEAFSQFTRYNKPIRIAKGLPQNITLAPGVNIPENSNMYTLMAILQEGDQVCIGEEPQEQDMVQGEMDFQDETKTEEKTQGTNVSPEITDEKKEEKNKPQDEKLKKKWARISDILGKLFEPEEE